MHQTAPDDESFYEAGTFWPPAQSVNGRIGKELDHGGVYLADDEHLNIEQLLQTVVGEISREGAVAHAHV